MREPTMMKLLDAVAVINQRLALKEKPSAKTGIVLGSGLGQFAETLKCHNLSSSLSFKEIPHFGESTVDGHKGELIYGLVKNEIPIIAINGRLHFYEGYDANHVVFPLRALQLLGVSTLVLTNASGAINDNFEPGELMVIKDHINLTGTSPLIGKNISELGRRFVDMTDCYDNRLIETAKNAAMIADITMHEGIYAGLLGPNYRNPCRNPYA